jgi:site-specific recombinase XerD
LGFLVEEAIVVASSRRKPGRLGPQVDDYRAWLLKRGYSPDTVRNMLKLLGQIGRWLVLEDLAVADLDESHLDKFTAARRAAGDHRCPGTRGMRPLLGFLRESALISALVERAAALDGLLSSYQWWMVTDRGLAEATVLRYRKTARRFLQAHAVSTTGFDPASLTGAAVNTFLLGECARVSSGSAKGRVAELRSLLRFLYLKGITPAQLGTAVPPVGGWRLATIPQTVTPESVQRLLDCCDKTVPVGVRDFAVIMLLARLGLRSIEVARLELVDLDWRAGEIVVRGKAKRHDRLPLPTPVGEALVDYLREVRGHATDPHVFLTCRAPKGPIRADLIGDVVERACHRAGLPVVGPHRLRHSLAADMLRHGAGLVAISQVLRHQDLATTAVYAKVDLAVLGEIAKPWIGDLS